MSKFVFFVLLLAIHFWATHQMDLGKNYYALGLLVLDFILYVYLKRKEEDEDMDEWEADDNSLILDEHYETLK